MIFGSATLPRFFGMAGIRPTRLVGGAARRSESSEMSFLRSSLTSEAGRNRPGSALARFSTQV